MARPKKKKGDETESPELPLENGEGTPPPENGEKAAPAAGGGDENRGNIVSTDIENEMKDSYLDYAMSVIVGRALPDVRDGLKPVHRRIFMGMHDLCLTSRKPYRKSAKVTGDVTGNYHPHGTASVYDTIVRLAQDFSMRYVAGRRAGQLRLHRRRPAGRRTLHRSAHVPLGRGAPQGHRQEHRRFRPQLRRHPRRTPGPALRLPQLPRQRLHRASPWAWPPTSRPITWAK